MHATREEEFAEFLKDKYNITNTSVVSGSSFKLFHDHFTGYDVHQKKLLFIKTDKTNGGTAASREANILQLPSIKASPFFPKVVHYSGHSTFPFVAFEYIEGLNLNEIVKNPSLKSKLFSNKKSLQTCIDQFFSVLTILNKEKIIHRDIQPNNIMVTLNPAGEFKNIVLIDFALSVGKDRFPELPFLNDQLLKGLGRLNYKPEPFKWDNKYAVIKIITQIDPHWKDHFPLIWDKINNFDELVYSH